MQEEDSDYLRLWGRLRN